MRRRAASIRGTWDKKSRLSATDRPLQRTARGNLCVPPSTLKLQAILSAQPVKGPSKLTVMTERAYDALSKAGAAVPGVLLATGWPLKESSTTALEVRSAFADGLA